MVVQTCVLFSADCKVEEISRSADIVSRDQNPETTQLDDGFVEVWRPLNFNKPIPQVGSNPKSIFRQYQNKPRDKFTSFKVLPS